MWLVTQLSMLIADLPDGTPILLVTIGSLYTERGDTDNVIHLFNNIIRESIPSTLYQQIF